MKVAIAILTCDRRQFGATENYFPQMWESMRKSGILEQQEPGDAIGIFDAGPRCLDWCKQCLKKVGCRVEGVEYWHGPCRGRLDLIRNTTRAFAWMVARGCDYGIWLPDDVICVKNWLPEVKRWLADSVPKGAAGYALAPRYPWSRDPENLKRRWAPYPHEQMWFSIAAMSNEMIRRYLFSETFQAHQQWDVGTDFILRDLCREYGLVTYGHCPDLFTDIGVQSSIYHPWVEGPHNLMFPGEEYDALAGGPLESGSEMVAKWVAWDAAMREKGTT